MIECLITLALTIYTAYILKSWSNELKTEVYVQGPVQSNLTFLLCMSIDTGVKIISMIQLAAVPKTLLIMFLEEALRPEMTPFLFLYLTIASTMIIGLVVKDNNTEFGRRAMYLVFLIFVVLISRPLNLYFVISQKKWASVCKDSSDPDCERDAQFKEVTFASLGYLVDIYFCRILYLYW